ncbi:MAG: DNA polymerase III subunit alpha [Hyphomicrobiaceae bacterium]
MSQAIRTRAAGRDAQSPAPAFVHLRCRSAYSLLEGALPVARLAKLATADAMPALALTDTSNLFGALEFSEKLASVGIQPIIGCTLQIDFEERVEGPLADIKGQGEPVAQLAGGVVLLAKDATGYANLMRLSSATYLSPRDNEPPHIKLSTLAGLAEGLIVLTGGPDGPIDRALRDGQHEKARERLKALHDIAGDRLYVELQRHGLPDERRVEADLLDMAYAGELPIVATNEPYFATAEDYEAHDALLCIAEGAYITQDDRRRLTREHYFKTRAEMAALFADLPEAVAATVEVAQRCAFRPRGRKPILPQFVRAEAGESPEAVGEAEAAELRRQAEDGLRRRLELTGPAAGMSEEDYWKRLDYEVGIIARMRFPGYFLIVSDFIKWAKAQGIPVGPGRGSGAGSLVAYALTITDLDPLRFGLLFERFLNPERVSMPDFDIDFCQDRRDEVIRYVQERYGADRVAQIITYGKLMARAVLRDVGRVLGMSYNRVDQLCKLVPNNPANPVTLAEAIDGEPALQEARDNDPMVAQLLVTAQKLEGLYRHASTHAAGVVIGDRPLEELVPLYRDPRSTLPATQFNLKWVEAAGLVKFDFLGLKTLTVIQKAVELVRAGGHTLDLERLGLDDVASYELLSRADTVGVFQLESTGMRDSLRKLRPDRFEDIIAMVALYRPGPMDNIPVYIARKHGQEEVDYLHPMLEPVLKETYGVIIYQEQVQQIAQVMAGYTLGQADILRRAMGKKIKEEMAKEKSRFVEGAVANGVDKAQAEFIFELVDKFAGYGFNKSHAAAYALVAYHTAYLKANFPVEFLAASMTLDMGNTDKLHMFAQEARRLAIPVKPPCVNASGREFRTEAGAIRYSLAALKNIGVQSVDHFVATRGEGGPYRSLSDFARRLNPKMINKRAVETLAAAGAFDQLEPNRALVHANADSIMALAQRVTADAAAGQNDLFGTPSAPPELELKPERPWLPMTQLEREHAAVGFFLSGHPLDAYQSLLERLGVVTYVALEARCERGSMPALMAGVVTSLRERRSKSGNAYAFVGFSDPSGQFETIVFSEALTASRKLLVAGTPVLLRVEAERDSDVLKLRAQSIEALDQAAKGVQRGLRVVLDPARVAAGRQGLAELARNLSGGGRGEIRLVLPLAEAGREIEFTLPGRFDVSPAVAGALSVIEGVLGVQDL